MTKILIIHKKKDGEYRYCFKKAGVESHNYYIDLYMVFSCKEDLFNYLTRLEFNQKTEDDYHIYKNTKLLLECLNQAYEEWES